MLRPWLVAALFLTLSGCSSGAGPDESVSPTTSDAATTSDAPLPVVRTDTLHLLNPPHMAGLLPTTGEVIRTPLPIQGLNPQPSDVPVPVWSLPAPALDEIKATLRLVVDVQGVIASNTFVSGSSCFWNIEFLLIQADGTAERIIGWCYGEERVVPTGIRTLEFTPAATLPDLVGGERLGFSVAGNGAPGPGATVHVLSGTTEFDSSLAIERLQFPLDTVTLTH